MSLCTVGMNPWIKLFMCFLHPSAFWQHPTTPQPGHKMPHCLVKASPDLTDLSLFHSNHDCTNRADWASLKELRVESVSCFSPSLEFKTQKSIQPDQECWICFNTDNKKAAWLILSTRLGGRQVERRRTGLQGGRWKGSVCTKNIWM